jgi:hypothetical protein
MNNFGVDIGVDVAGLLTAAVTAAFEEFAPPTCPTSPGGSS